MKATALLNNTLSSKSSPALLDIPDSCIIKSGKPFFIPEFDTDFRAYASIAIRIERLGKCIATRFAHRYYSQLTAAVSMRAENLLSSLRKEGLPWSEAVAFDRSMFLGDFITLEEFKQNGNTLRVECGCEEIILSADNLKMGIDEVIAYVSRNNTLRTGDIILAGLSDEGIPVAIATAPQHLHAYVGERKILATNIR